LLNFHLKLLNFHLILFNCRLKLFELLLMFLSQLIQCIAAFFINIKCCILQHVNFHFQAINHFTKLLAIISRNHSHFVFKGMYGVLRILHFFKDLAYTI